MDLPKIIRYYEPKDIGAKEKEEIREYLLKLPVTVRIEPTFKIPAIHYMQDEEMQVIEGRKNIISKLAEFLQS